MRGRQELTADLIEMVGLGTSAEVFALSPSCVVKLYFPEIRDEMIEGEFAAAELAATLGVPVARPVGRMIAKDRRGIVFERAPGEQMLRHMQHRPFAAVKTTLRLARLHAAIHSRELTVGLPSLRGRLESQIENSPVSSQVRERAMVVLTRMAETPPRLCHGDLHPGNVFVQRSSLIAIDWSRATLGPPAADAARTELLLRYGQHGRWEQRYAAVRLGRHWLAEWYLAGYTRATGIERRAIAAWHLPVAVAWLRHASPISAAMLEGLINRLARERI